MTVSLPSPSELPSHRGQSLLLTPEEAAAVLGVGRTKLYELLRDGELESIRIGASRRVPRVAVLEFIDRLRVEASVDWSLSTGTPPPWSSPPEARSRWISS